MADNVQLSTNVGTGEVAATDQVDFGAGAVHVQQMKLVDGADGGTARIGGDATNGLDVDVTRVIPGTGATNLGKAEDVASAGGDTGVAVLSVRQDTPAGDTSTDGDYQFVKSNSVGRIYVEATVAAAQTLAAVTTVGTVSSVTAIANALPAGTNNIGDVDVLTLPALPAGTNNIGDVDVLTVNGVAPAFGTGVRAATVQRVTIATDDVVPVSQSGSWSLAANQSVNVAQINGVTVLMGNGASGTGAQRVTIANDSTGILAGVTTVSTVTSLTQMNGQAISMGTGVRAAGTQRVTIATDDVVPASQSGAWTVGLSAGTNTNEVVGDAAHDAAIAGNPVRIGARAMTADFTAVATGDTVDVLATTLGKAVIYPYALPGSTWSYAAPAGGLVSTTAVTIKAAAGAGIRNYITHIDAVNSHATISTELVINDGAAGTVLWRGWLQAAGGGYSINFDPPLRSTANTLLEIDEVTATATAGVVFNCTGFTSVE